MSTPKLTPPQTPTFNAPNAPDPFGAAQQQANFTGNAAQQSRLYNLPSWQTPYGSLSTTQTGDIGGVPQFTQTLALSPEQQALQTQRNALMTQAGQGIGQQFGNLSSAINKPLDLSSTAVENYVSGLARQRLDPIMAQQSAQLDQQLANQGIPLGSEAYNNAKMQLARQQNDQMNQMLLGARQQGVGEMLTQYQAPISAATTGISAFSPYAPQVTYPTAPQGLPNIDVAAPNYLGAQMGLFPTQMAGAETGFKGQLAGYQGQMEAAKQELASQAALYGALGSIGGTILGGPIGGAIGGGMGNYFGGGTGGGGGVKMPSYGPRF